MKKFGIFLLTLSLTMGAVAQDETESKQLFFSRLEEKNILNHMDVGVNVGTMGLGIDVAMPIGDYVRVRAGYTYMPSFTLHADFPIHRASAFVDKFGKINEKLAKNGIDITLPYFKEEKELMDIYNNGNWEAKDYITLKMKPNMHQFKFLVDVLPFKNNKHWSFTAGFFVGPSVIGNACNVEKDTPILRAVNLYNSRYYRDYVLHEMDFQYVDANGKLHHGEINSLTEFVKTNGLAGYTMGRFHDGRKALMLPGNDAKARAEMEVSKFRPYLGFGYNTHLSKDKKWNMNIDVGIMFFCGTPRVYVDNIYKIDDSPLRLDENGNYLSGIGIDQYGNYYGDIVRWNEEEVMYELVDVEKVDHVDLARDLDNIPDKVNDILNTISKFKVYPNASVTFSYRLF